MGQKVYLNPNIFFLLNEGRIFLWNFQDHEQFEVEISCFLRLQEVSKGNTSFEKDSIDKILLANNVISLTPYPKKDWGWDDLSYIFHKGTSDLRPDEEETGDWLQDYLAFSERTGTEEVQHSQKQDIPTEKLTYLPPPSVNTIKMDLVESLYARKTCRQFFKSQMSLEDLSTLLFLSFGYIHGPWTELKNAGLEVDFQRKSSPSGGCLHPIIPYIIPWNVKGLAKSTYKYIPEHHALFKTNTLPKTSAFNEMLAGQYFHENCALGVFLCADFSKSWDKYQHSRAYRVVMLDAGHVSQTFQLVSTGLQKNTWLSAFFSDSPAKKILNTDLEPLLFLSVGKSDGASLPKGL